MFQIQPSLPHVALSKVTHIPPTSRKQVSSSLDSNLFSASCNRFGYREWHRSALQHIPTEQLHSRAQKECSPAARKRMID